MPQCRESIVHMSHIQENYEKKLYIEIWYEQTLLTAKWYTRNAKITEDQLLHMQELPLTTPMKNCMCVAKDICINMYVKFTTK